MTLTAKTHGLDGTLVEPDWPPLTFDEIRSLLSKMPRLGEPLRILSVSPRPFSAAGVIETSRRQVFVKRHSLAVRDGEGLLEEHRFMHHLRLNGIEVPGVFATENGETAVKNGEWTYEVHEVPSGVDLYEDALSWTPFRSTEHARTAGEMLARLHLAAEKYDAPARKPRPLVASFTIFAGNDPHDALKAYLTARPALDQHSATREDCKLALELLTPFHNNLKNYLPSLAPLWTHNDLHASNLFWSDDCPQARPKSVIDFGLSDRTNAVYDLAQAIERNIVEWLQLRHDSAEGNNIPVHLDHLSAMLDGYEKVRPLSQWEASALVPMVALGHTEFALTEADYFLGVLNSVDKARIATRDYLVKHAEWFRGPGRRLLLDPLQRWAERREGGR